jgi:hypothetical protein
MSKLQRKRSYQVVVANFSESEAANSMILIIRISGLVINRSPLKIKNKIDIFFMFI